MQAASPAHHSWSRLQSPMKYSRSYILYAQSSTKLTSA